MSETLTDHFAFYERHGAALFPIPAGQKAPFGIVSSFKHDSSTDPASWKAWQIENPGCNFGVVGFASNWIIADIDTSGGESGRAEAWQAWTDLCATWGIVVATPHVQSARGGWHVYFQVPAGVDAATLRQPDAIRKRINIRCVGYTVAAGSYYDGTAKGEQSGPYLLMSDAAPYPAPAALVAHCTRAPVSRVAASTLPGSRDKGDVAALLVWLNDHGAFEDYESWFQIGMALRLEYGDDGFDLWELTHDGTVSPDAAASKWNSFATDPTSQSVTLNSFLDRAHRLGWRGTVRKSTAAMFDGVAQLAAMSGASLHSGMPTTGVAGLPMLAGQEVLARLAAPILTEFLEATADTPPSPKDFPTLPAAMAGHDLYVPMVASIARIAGMIEQSKFKPTRVIDAMVVLNLLHADVFEAVCRRVRDAGHTLPDRKIKLGANALSDKVQRAFVQHDDWIYDARTGLPEHDNPDNFCVFLDIIGCEVRFNAWLERMEIRGGNDAELRWNNWTYIDDTIVVKLRMRALRAKTRFKIGKDFTFEALLDLAHKNTVDPVVDLLARLEAEWDGTPRLSGWLATYCGVPNDTYHKAVARLLVGGMVTRIRTPGVKFDTMPIFYGKQGTGKSTMLSILAMSPAYFSDSILLGDASKELVLSLAGKALVEISEMGIRGNTNIAHVKAMLSRDTDAGRTAYARSVTERPRRNIFCGTTNEESPLVDTENRRFLPVAIDTEIDLQGLRRDVFQLVGEAAALHAQGETFDLPRSVWAEAATHQEAARSVSDVEARLCTWFAPGLYTQEAFVSTDDLAELSDLCGWRGVHSFRNGVLKRLGFREVQPYLSGVRVRGWQRGAGRVEAAVRYTVGKSAADGRVRVGVKAGVGVAGVPPLPY